MALRIRDGDYVPGPGGLAETEGSETLLQNVLFRLTARRGSFPFWPELGSRLYQLGRLPVAERQGAAEQYVAEAMAQMPELTVTAVTLEDDRLRVAQSPGADGVRRADGGRRMRRCGRLRRFTRS